MKINVGKGSHRAAIGECRAFAPFLSYVLSHCQLLPLNSLSERWGSRKNYEGAEANANWY